jgi:hypothetical protein
MGCCGAKSEPVYLLDHTPGQRGCAVIYLIVPCGTWLLLIAVPLLFLRRGRRAFAIASGLSVSVLLWLVLSVYVPGWTLRVRAGRGDPQAQYDYARWTETHCIQLTQVLLWPCFFLGDGREDALEGYAWLERAAAQDYPPAVWLVGVRLKYGYNVPRPARWPANESGNYFPQPERGQQMIDRAIRLGFQPPADEERYYWKVFQRPDEE